MSGVRCLKDCMIELHDWNTTGYVRFAKSSMDHYSFFLLPFAFYLLTTGSLSFCKCRCHACLQRSHSFTWTRTEIRVDLFKDLTCLPLEKVSNKPRQHVHIQRAPRVTIVQLCLDCSNTTSLKLFQHLMVDVSNGKSPFPPFRNDVIFMVSP